MSRAAKNAGTIRHRPDGCWEARINLGRDPGTGKQRQRSVYGKPQKEVRQKLNEITQKRDEGTLTEPSKLTVGEWLDAWEKTYLLSVRPSTADLYRQKIRLYLKPSLGATKLKKLTHDTVQVFYSDLSEKLSSKSVKDIHGVLHKALEQAVANGYIPINPTTGCALPKAERAEIRPLTEDQQKAFLKAIQGHVHEDLYRVDLFTGMREGEILGLKWSCVDFDSGTILIDKQLRKDQKKAENITTPHLRTARVGQLLLRQ